MSTVFVRAARGGRSFALKVDALEGRDCPSSITFHDGLLTVVGDRGDDSVAVVNTWAGTQVTCNFTKIKSEATFTDVRAIDVRTLGGDDRVSFVSVSGERPVPVPALRVDLGSGNDTFVADIGGVLTGPVDVAVSGGAGREDVLVSLASDQPADRVFVLVDGGAGDDSLTASTDFLPTVQSAAVPETQFTLDMDGGAGDDTMFYLKQRAVTHKGTAHLAGGRGNDFIAVVVRDAVADLADTRDHTDIDGGAGNDRLSFVDLPAEGTRTLLGYSYVVTMHGGAGDDVLKADVSYFGGVTPTDTGSVLEYGDGGEDKLTLLYDAPYSTLLMDGGPGTDTGLSPTRHTANVDVVGCEL